MRHQVMYYYNIIRSEYQGWGHGVHNFQLENILDIQSVKSKGCVRGKGDNWKMGVFWKTQI